MFKQIGYTHLLLLVALIVGLRIDLPGRTDPLTDSLGSMELDTIEGIEVFRGLSEMPVEFAEPDLRCGAIALWMRR